MRRAMIAGAALLLGTVGAQAKCSEDDVDGLWIFYGNAVNCAVEFVDGGKIAHGTCHYKAVDGPKSSLSGAVEINKRCEITGTLKEKAGKKTFRATVAARVREGKYALIAEGTLQNPDGVASFYGVKQW